MIIIADFESSFERLTDFPPFEWQKRLYRDYFAKGQIPSALDIPTGLGKTSVMAIWYLALKDGAAVPRRLVYVVDRRAVVDQATTVADAIRMKSEDSELRVSTLRGQYVDNKEWLADPAAAAIVVGTVDMIGSRLLFSGYGVSRKMRPYHAGMLGADALVVLDEAHLVPPFEKLLETIANGAEAFGPHEQEHRKIVPSFKLLSLSATGREDGACREGVFRLSAEHRKDEIVRKRLEARKRLSVQVLDDAPKLVPLLAERAWCLGKEPARVLVYCDLREDAVKVKDRIDSQFKKWKREHVCELLVGGRRVFEREALSDWLKKHGFFGDAEGSPEQPTFLIATSAGEVGVDLDADHMVCDLVPWERMVQRLGRVNRRGNGDACIEVIAVPEKKKGEEWEARLARLRQPLDALRLVDKENVEGGDQLRLFLSESDPDPDEDADGQSLQTSGCEGPRDASPSGILDLRARAEEDKDLQDAIAEAATPVPLRPALTRALVDAWSMTSLDEHMGRPDDIQPWLRGWEEDQQPQTTVVWRKYLPVRKDGSGATPKEIEAFFEAAPPHASEKLETETYKVVEWLMDRAKNAINSKSWDGVRNRNLALRREDVIAYTLSPSVDLRDTVHGDSLIVEDRKEEKKAKEKLRQSLVGGTLVMDSRFGGLARDGMLDKKAGGSPRVIDDGEEWLPPQSNGSPAIRFRVRSFGEIAENDDENWRERHRFDVDKTDEGDVTRWLLIEKWRGDSETEDDRSAGLPQELGEHQARTECKARTLASAVGLPNGYVDMLAVAARLHDEGKRLERWQRAFNAPSDGKVYAKTKGPINVKLLDHYRHEFGSLPCAESDEEFKALSCDLQQLALHLVAAHHGWSRPVIPTSGSDEPPSVLEERALDVALRFARTQKKWGPWGLAWWESMLRAADQQASRDNDAGENA